MLFWLVKDTKERLWNEIVATMEGSWPRKKLKETELKGPFKTETEATSSLIESNLEILKQVQK